MAFDFFAKEEETLNVQNKEIQDILWKEKEGTWFSRAKDTVVDMVTSVGSTVSAGADYIESEFFTNVDEDKGIKDFDWRQRYNKMLENPELDDDDRASIYQLMQKDDIVDWNKYQSHANKQQAEYEASTSDSAKLSKKNTEVFRNKLKASIADNVKNIDNRYQLDVLSKGVDKLTTQYEMMYTNVLETYNQTKDDKILEERDNMQEIYENQIINFTKGFADKIEDWLTYKQAYSETVDEDKEAANKIVALQQSMQRTMYRQSIKSNFSDSLDDLKAFNIGWTVWNFFAWAMNIISAWGELAWQAIEEGKQTLWRYDMIEELANLNIYKEGTSNRTKWVGTLWSWTVSVFDWLPSLAPAIGTMLFGNKLAATSKIKNSIWLALNAKKLSTGKQLLAAGRKAEFVMDNVNDLFLLDAAFQTAIGRPMTDEDFISNWMFNLPINWLTARLTSKIKIADFAISDKVLREDFISKWLLNSIKKATSPEAAGESLFLAKSIWDKGTISVKDLAKTNQKLYEKVLEAQSSAINYRNTATTYDIWLSNELSADMIQADKVNWQQTADMFENIEMAKWRANQLTDYLGDPYNKETFLFAAKTNNWLINRLMGDW